MVPYFSGGKNIGGVYDTLIFVNSYFREQSNIFLRFQHKPSVEGLDIFSIPECSHFIKHFCIISKPMNIPPNIVDICANTGLKKNMKAVDEGGRNPLPNWNRQQSSWHIEYSDISDIVILVIPNRIKILFY